MCSDNKATTQKPWIWRACPGQLSLCDTLRGGEWAHPHQGLCLGAVPAPSSVRSPFPVSLLTKCLFWCVHILPDSAIWIEWEAPDLQKQPFKILHTGKKKKKKGSFLISEIVKSNFEAWNKAFSFLGFWILFSSSLALDLSISSFWNLEILFCSNACFFPVISLSLFLSVHILPLEHQGTALFSSQKAGDDLFKA